jgi:hypothetical protein
MSGFLGILSVGLGTLLAIVIAAVVIFWFIQDITQKKHAVLRNYPVIGRLRYFFEKQGSTSASTSSWATGTRCPFNRATRAWVYRVAKQEDGGGLIGFGSTYDIKAPGAILFSNAPFPVQEWERKPTPPLAIGEGWLHAPLRRALARQHQRHELRRDLQARGPGAVARRGGGGLLDGHGRGRPRAPPPRGRLRHHHADRNGEVWNPRQGRQLLAGAREGARAGGEGRSRSRCRRARSPAKAACFPAAR